MNTFSTEVGNLGMVHFNKMIKVNITNKNPYGHHVLYFRVKKTHPLCDTLLKY